MAEPPPILQLPPELLVLIIDLLAGIRDILSIRQTCRFFNKITYEREIWMKKLKEQHTYLPLPRELLNTYDHGDRHLHTYPDFEIESIVTEAEIISELWPRYRSHPPYKLHRENIGSTLMGMKLFLDRWLIIVYFEGAAYLYDTKPDVQPTRNTLITNEPTGGQPILRAALFLESGLWISHVVGLDHDGRTIYLALSRSEPPHMVQIYQISISILVSNSLFIPNAFHLHESIPLPLYKVIRAIDPERKLVALSTPDLVEVVNWDEYLDNPDHDMNTHKIRVSPDDMEGLWNGIIAVNLMGPFVLVFRTRSMEVHPAVGFVTRSEHPSQHKFNNMTFREVSFSQATITTVPASGASIIETTLFAYDVIQGLFHYNVRFKASSSHLEDDFPSLEVTLSGVYPLAVGLNHSTLYVPLSSRMPITNDVSTSTTYSANFTPSPSPTPISSHTAFTRISGTPRMLSHMDDGTRGFLSTHSLGSQGKRGIWVERKRSSTLREIQVWSRNSPSFMSSYEEQLMGASGVTAIEIPKRIVYSLQSFDLRDDITCCTIGELSGTIALGHRSGDVSILELHDEGI